MTDAEIRDMLASGKRFPARNRNDTLLVVAKFLRRNYPFDWQERTKEINMLLCNPPLNSTDVSRIVQHVEQAQYAERSDEASVRSAALLGEQVSALYRSLAGLPNDIVHHALGTYIYARLGMESK